MIEKAAIHITGKLIKKNIVCDGNKDIYVYGLDILLSTVITSITILLLGVLTFGFSKALVYLFVTAPLRRFGGGWHAPSHFTCALMQCIVFVLVASLSKMLSSVLTPVTLVIIFAICVFIILIKAPTEHPDNPLSKSSKNRAKACCLAVTLPIIIASAVLLAKNNILYSALMTLSAFSAITTYIFKNKSGGYEDD